VRVSQTLAAPSAGACVFSLLSGSLFGGGSIKDGEVAESLCARATWTLECRTWQVQVAGCSSRAVTLALHPIRQARLGLARSDKILHPTPISPPKVWIGSSFAACEVQVHHIRLKYQTTKMAVTEQDTQVPTLRKILTSESEPLARRFRALFSLKHVASLQPPNAQTVPAIEAIAAAFASPSALLKHELAYCLGQSGHDAAIAPLRGVLEDKEEDAMCRHEAAEALGALADKGSLDLLKQLRDDKKEEEVVRETCDIAVDRIEWEHGLQKGSEKLKKRYITTHCNYSGITNSRQRLHVHRPRATTTTEHRNALNTRTRKDPPRHVPTPLPALPSHVCSSRPVVTTRPTNRRPCCSGTCSRI